MSKVPTDIEIAQSVSMRPIIEVAKEIGLDEECIEPYGKHKAKVLPRMIKTKSGKEGKLILVTAISPTPAGEGKSTVSIGLAQAMRKRGHKTMLCLREPSLGPCMGIKGGAAGGGYSQVVPMDDINLHFTGDIHAVGAAHNLLSAMLDNSLQQGNPLGIDPRRVHWPRVLDMNDRALRQITIGLGGPLNGVPREDRFIITVASEVMAILCLAKDLNDLETRLGKIIIGYNFSKEPVFASQLEAQGAMALLLKDAIKPNLVQTLEGGPAFIHGGPFANIAHGCNSLSATRTALSISDYVVTEAGFGAELGAEKFFDIKCRAGGLKPAAAVLVATARALKMHGGVALKETALDNHEAVKKGLPNLEKQLENLQQYRVPVVVAINRFIMDSDKEIDVIRRHCDKLGVPSSVCEVWEKGSEGGLDLADKVVELADSGKSAFRLLYDENDLITEKLNSIAVQIYGAKGVDILPDARKDIERLEKFQLDKLPICIAKTQYSLSDNPSLLGRPSGFRISVRHISPSNGAGFLVALTGDIMTMPGLPRKPAATNMRIDEDGRITGLF